MYVWKKILKGLIILNRGSIILFLKFLSCCFANIVFFGDLGQVKDSMHKFRIFIVMFSFFGWIQNLVRTLPSVLFGTRGNYLKNARYFIQVLKTLPFLSSFGKRHSANSRIQNKFQFSGFVLQCRCHKHCVQFKFFCN
jgi:hypothetical protein